MIEDDESDGEEFDDVGIECTSTLEGHSGQILCLTSLSTSLIATGGCYVDKSIRVWNVQTGEQVSHLRGFTSSCLVLRGLPDDAVCSGHENGQIYVWDVPSGQLRHELAGHWRHRAPVLAICALPGNFLASCANSADRHVRIWNWTQRNACVHVLKPQVEIELEGHDEKVVLGPTRRGVRVNNIIDMGKDTIACVEWGAIHVWKWKEAKLVATTQLEDTTTVRPLLFLGAGMVATGENSGKVVIYRLRDGELARSMEGHERPVWGIFALTHSMDCLATGSLDETIRVWKWRNCGPVSHQCLAAVRVGPIIGPANIVPLGNSCFVCGGADEFIRVFLWKEWNKQAPGKLVARIGGHIDNIKALLQLPIQECQEEVSPGNIGMFASVSEDQVIKVWSMVAQSPQAHAPSEFATQGSKSHSQ